MPVRFYLTIKIQHWDEMHCLRKDHSKLLHKKGLGIVTVCIFLHWLWFEILLVQSILAEEGGSSSTKNV